MAHPLWRGVLAAIGTCALAWPATAQEDPVEAQIQELIRGKRIWLRETSPPEAERPRAESARVLHPRTDEALRVVVIRRGEPDAGPRVVALYSAADRAFWTVAWRRGDAPIPAIVNGPYALRAERAVSRDEVEKALRALIPADGDVGHFDGMYDSVAALGRGAILHLTAIARDEGLDPVVRQLAVEAMGECAAPEDLSVLRELAGTELFSDAPLSQSAVYALAKLGDRTRLDQQIEYLKGRIEQFRRMRPGDPGLGALWSTLALRHLRVDAYDDAIRCYREAIQAAPAERGNNLYNLACAFALKGEPERALDALEQAVREGYRGFEWMKRDGDLRSLRELPRFQKLLEGRTKKEY